MRAFLTNILPKFTLSVFVTFIIASAFQTHFMLQELITLGVEVDFETRLTATMKDFIGLLPGYGTIIFIGLAIGFFAMSKVQSKYEQIKPICFPLAGGITFITMFTLMHPLLEITLIASTRSAEGYVLQCVSGILGGLTFQLLLQRTNKTTINIEK